MRHWFVAQVSGLDPWNAIDIEKYRPSDIQVHPIARRILVEGVEVYQSMPGIIRTTPWTRPPDSKEAYPEDGTEYYKCAQSH